MRLIDKKKIKLEQVDTRNQIADIFTKPLTGSTFEDLRKRLSLSSDVRFRG